MASLFGTDGVRGLANVELTPDLVLSLGRAAAESITIGPVLVGRDTRRSGAMLSAAFQAGVHSVGIDTVDVGVLPSGGIAQLTALGDATMGAVVTASHNPAPDNGIKLLAGSGHKLSDEREAAIEARMQQGSPWRRAEGADVGTAYPMPNAGDRYLEVLTKDFGYSLRGISLVLDCANGAAHEVAPELFRSLAADVEVIGATPDGVNINDGVGATAPELLAKTVKGRIGFAFDGDADRLIAVDETGAIADGDVIMAVIARHLLSRGELANDTIVTTVMANIGFHKAMAESGIRVVTTAVGDRYVLEAIRSEGAALGGEQSGHVIFPGRAPSGDGLLTALVLMEVIAATGRPLSELRSFVTQYPQVLRGVRVADTSKLDANKVVWDSVRAVEALLGDDGRVLVRASGTEPLVRVMIEAPDREAANRHALDLCSVIRDELA